MNDSNRINSDRIIHSINLEGRPEWFCLVREGMLGPYPSEEAAHQALADFLRWAQQVGCTGRREGDKPAKAYLSHPDTMRWLAAGVVDHNRL